MNLGLPKVPETNDIEEILAFFFNICFDDDVKQELLNFIALATNEVPEWRLHIGFATDCTHPELTGSLNGFTISITDTSVAENDQRTILNSDHVALLPVNDDKIIAVVEVTEYGYLPMH